MSRHVGADVVGEEVGADGLVAAGDVVADPGRADVVGVGDGAADRLRVADVAVGAQDAASSVAGLAQRSSWSTARWSTSP
jgi:hypothetical protein